MIRGASRLGPPTGERPRDIASSSSEFGCVNAGGVNERLGGVIAETKLPGCVHAERGDFAGAGVDCG